MQLAEALQVLGHQVCIFALDKDGTGFCRPIACQYELVPTQPALPSTDRLVQQRIQEYLDYFSQHDLSYDIFHAQDCISANALVMLRDRQQIPHVIRTVHHIDEYNSPYLQQCQTRSILAPDLCLCVSQYWQQEIKRQYNIDAGLVLNGVDPKRFSPQLDGSETQLKQRLGLNGSPIYLTIGGIEPRKNSIKLLQAFAQVLKQHPQAQLVIAGGMTFFDYEPYQKQFFAEAERMGVVVGRSLILPGMIPDIDLPALYRSADAFVFPSVKEGWGLVVMEAIASRIPVITSNQPPFTEFLSPDSALLIDPYSPDAIASAMQSIIRPQVANVLLQQSESISSRYTWESSAHMHLNYYQLLRTPIAR
jgi:glycosyltransferase-like protein